MDAVISYNVPHLFGEGGVMPWGFLIVLHFFLSGLSAGAFLTSAAASAIDGVKYRKMATVGAYMSFLALLADIPLLILDLDRPLRFINMLFHFNVTAPLSWGVLFITGLFIFSLLNILIMSGNEAVAKMKSAILCIGSILAIGVSAYTAIALNIATNARPIWANGIVIPLFIVASIITGTAAVSLVLALTGDEKPSLSCLGSTNAVLVLAQLIMVVSLLISISTSSPISQELAHIMLKGDMALLVWGGLLFIGLVSPMFILWMTTMSKKEGSIGSGTSALVSVMILTGVFILRYLIVYGGQILPLT